MRACSQCMQTDEYVYKFQKQSSEREMQLVLKSPDHVFQYLSVLYESARMCVKLYVLTGFTLSVRATLPRFPSSNFSFLRIILLLLLPSFTLSLLLSFFFLFLRHQILISSRNPAKVILYIAFFAFFRYIFALLGSKSAIELKLGLPLYRFLCDAAECKSIETFPRRLMEITIHLHGDYCDELQIYSRVDKPISRKVSRRANWREESQK